MNCLLQSRARVSPLALRPRFAGGGGALPWLLPLPVPLAALQHFVTRIHSIGQPAMEDAAEAQGPGFLDLPDALLRRIALLLNPLDR